MKNFLFIFINILEKFIIKWKNDVSKVGVKYANTRSRKTKNCSTTFIIR
jgi:hypothetical protein